MVKQSRQNNAAINLKISAVYKQKNQKATMGIIYDRAIFQELERSLPRD